ncbi:MAG: PIN domain-containing protein [Pseudomonadota bacterium]
MKLVIDTCVLFPTIMRGLILGVAQTGAFTPIWSPRILEEWSRAAARDGRSAGVDIALLRDRFPTAEIKTPIRDDLWLPDENDVHVLATGLHAQADGILTLNIKDFPTRILTAHGLLRRDPDGFLLELHAQDPDPVVNVVQSVVDQAIRDGAEMSPRALLKRSKLPRLAKALYA